jgi:hypothetical protein
MEDKEIRNLIPAFLRRKGTQLDMTQWNAIDPESGIPLKDKELQYALQYRKNHDPRYNEIVEKARNAGKYLLYISVRRNESELGGVLVLESNRKQGKIAGTIEGENKVGKMIMKLYNFPF